MIDREKLQQKLQSARARSAGGAIRFMKEGTHSLRIIPFTDADGSEEWYREMQQWTNSGAGSFKPLLDRSMFGAPDAVARLNALADEAGETTSFKPFTRYLVNAIDTNEKGGTPAIYQLPTSVWMKIAELLLSQQWHDLIDLKTGHPLLISRTGSGLSTEYECVPGRSPWVVAEKMAAKAVDPFTKLVDPGIRGQCEAIGINPNDLWDDPSELGKFDPVSSEELASESKKRAPTSSRSAAKKSGSRSEGTELGEGVEVQHEDGSVGVVASVDGDKVYCEFDGEEFECFVGDLTVMEPEPEADGPATGVLMKGARVTADLDGETYAGSITKINDDDTLQVTFDDGDVIDFSADDLTLEGDSELDAQLPIPEDAKASASKVTGRRGK